MIVINGELYSSKNSRQIFKNKATGKFFVTKSNVAKTDEIELTNKLRSVREDFLREIKYKIPPYRINFKIYRKTYRRFDYINIIQNLCDCMVRAGLISDDNADILLPEFEPYEVDKWHPRVEISVM